MAAFEDRINKLLDEAEQAKSGGNISQAIEKYLKVADIYFATGEKSTDPQIVEKCLRYGKAFVRAAEVLERA